MCVCVWACLTVLVGSENQELTILVGSDSFVGTDMMDNTHLNACFRVKNNFRLSFKRRLFNNTDKPFNCDG